MEKLTKEEITKIAELLILISQHDIEEENISLDKEGYTQEEIDEFGNMGKKLI